MFIPTSPTLNPLLAIKALFSGKLEPKNRLMYFSFARAGLITAIESIRFNNGIIGKSNIWLPAYICDTVVIILREYSVNCKYYKVTADLKPDFDALEKEDICPGDFFLLVHYFGFSISQKETIDFCMRKKLYLIEDCAHSIVKNIGKSKIGTQGDAGIFGLRKVLPIPNGGILFLKEGKFVLPKTLFSYPSEYRGILKMILQWFFQKIGISWSAKHNFVNKNNYPTMSKNYYFFNCRESISKWSEKIITATNLTKVENLRRENFQFLHDNLSDIESIKIPSSLTLDNQEIVPWIFFFYHAESERIINMLIENGITASTFPTLPSDVFNNPDWASENAMYRSGITLPIHQDVTKIKMQKIVNLIKKHT
jgi:hypothetical protein